MSDSKQNLLVMFVDISGSTRLFSKYGNERALSLISTCINTLKSIIEQYNGTIVQTFGDGILCTFTSADAAFQAALDFCRTQHDQAVSIHAGLHYGSVIVQADSIYGDAVNIASRLADKAKKEEIILSENVVHRLSPQFQERTRPLRNRAFLKGKQEPMKLYKIIAEDVNGATALMSISDFPILRDIQLELAYRGQVFTLKELDSDFVLGRLDECDLVIQHEYASRHHATIDCKPGKFTLSDHSSNGSYVQDEQHKLIVLNRDSLQLYGNGLISLGIEPARNPEYTIEFRICNHV